MNSQSHVLLEHDQDFGPKIPFYAGSLGAASQDNHAPGILPLTDHPVKGKVLVMDDDETMQEILGDMLPSMGYVSGHARDGAEAMEMYRLAMETGDPFDVVIMDLTVSTGMGGLEAVQELLRMDPEAKVIVSSGYADDPAMLDCRKYGFSGGLDKPFKIKDLQDLLERLVSMG